VGKNWNIGLTLMCLALLAAIAGSANAAPPARSAAMVHTINVNGHVDLQCEAMLHNADAIAQPGLTDLGLLTERCNSPTGFKVWLYYPATLTDASVVVDGRHIPLNGSGAVVIDQSETAAVSRHTLALYQPGGYAAADIAIRIRAN